MSNLRNGVHNGKCSSARSRGLSKRIRERLGSAYYPLPNAVLDDTIPDLRISEVRLLLALIPLCWNRGVQEDGSFWWTLKRPGGKEPQGIWHGASKVREAAGLSARRLREAGEGLADQGLIAREKRGPGLGWTYRLTSELAPPDPRAGCYTCVPGWLLREPSKLSKGSEEGPLRIMVAVIRKTLGWQKLRDRISYQQLQEMTGLSSATVAKGLSDLCKRSFLQRESCGGGVIYELPPPPDEPKGDPRTNLKTAPRTNLRTQKNSYNPKRNNKEELPQEALSNNGGNQPDFVDEEGVDEQLAEELAQMLTEATDGARYTLQSARRDLQRYPGVDHVALARKAIEAKERGIVQASVIAFYVDKVKRWADRSPEHLATYGYDEYRQFLSLGFAKEHFGGAGRDLYRYVDPREKTGDRDKGIQRKMPSRQRAGTTERQQSEAEPESGDRYSEDQRAAFIGRGWRPAQFVICREASERGHRRWRFEERPGERDKEEGSVLDAIGRKPARDAGLSVGDRVVYTPWGSRATIAEFVGEAVRVEWDAGGDREVLPGELRRVQKPGLPAGMIPLADALN